MAIFFEIMKSLFFVFTVVLGLFKLRADQVLGDTAFVQTVKQPLDQFLVPGYLVLCGLMCGYLIAQIWASQFDDISPTQQTSLYLKSFLIGLVVGVLLAVMWIFVG